MADFTVSGLSGPASGMNGDYSASGTCDGHTAYTNGSYWLYHFTFGMGQWGLSLTEGETPPSQTYGGSDSSPLSSAGAWQPCGPFGTPDVESGGGGGTTITDTRALAGWGAQGVVGTRGLAAWGAQGLSATRGVAGWGAQALTLLRALAAWGTGGPEALVRALAGWGRAGLAATRSLAASGRETLAAERTLAAYGLSGGAVDILGTQLLGSYTQRFTAGRQLIGRMVTVPSGGLTISSLHAAVGWGLWEHQYTGLVKLAVYDSDGNLAAETGVLTVPFGAATWVGESITPAALSAGNYLLAIISPDVNYLSAPCENSASGRQATFSLTAWPDLPATITPVADSYAPSIYAVCGPTGYNLTGAVTSGSAKNGPPGR